MFIYVRCSPSGDMDDDDDGFWMAESPLSPLLGVGGACQWGRDLLSTPDFRVPTSIICPYIYGTPGLPG
jgi:hypothetical protein